MIVFDLDGTLVDSREHILNYNRDLFRWLGRPFPEQDAELFYTLDRHALEQRFFDEDLVRVAQFRERDPYLDRLSEIRPLSGALELLSSLRQRGIALALWTNRGPSTKPLLAQLGWEGLFDIVLHADMAVPSKPSPDGARWIASRWELAPADLLFVGDSAVDREAARLAGCAFVQCAQVSPPLPQATSLPTLQAVGDYVARWLRGDRADYNEEHHASA
ncbi:MAG: HAD family hydrolase [Candidatus Dadabacteria bacterium]|nr:MAG: HAD family hydrolase [Candidatus Dadabacteria bacterium]